MATLMKQRRGTAAEWATVNPVLDDGEIGWARDTGVVKIGDGITAWAGLPVILGGYYARNVDVQALTTTVETLLDKRNLYQTGTGAPYAPGGMIYVGVDFPPAPFEDGSLFFKKVS